MSLVRILVVDDHEVVRKGLRAVLEAQQGWEVCGEAVNGREGKIKAKELKPDIVTLDIGMPELNGLEATRQILKAAPKTEVLVLTIHESEELIRSALEAGARGYVLKSDIARDLVSAVETLLQHRPFLSSRASAMVLHDSLQKGSRHDAEGASRYPLTPREREIVQLLAEGKSNKEVAAILGITPKTAETHRANIMHKLGLHSLAELVRYAIRNKIVQP